MKGRNGGVTPSKLLIWPKQVQVHGRWCGNEKKQNGNSVTVMFLCVRVDPIAAAEIIMVRNILSRIFLLWESGIFTWLDVMWQWYSLRVFTWGRSSFFYLQVPGFNIENFIQARKATTLFSWTWQCSMCRLRWAKSITLIDTMIWGTLCSKLDYSPKNQKMAQTLILVLAPEKSTFSISK